MELIYNLAFVLFILGIFLIYRNTDKRSFWGGVVLLVLAVSIWIAATNTNVDKNLIGIHVIKNTKAEYIVEMRFFNLKSEAFEFYKKHKIDDFSLVYRFGDDTKHFFSLIGQKNDDVKRIRFTENKKSNKTAFEVYQDFFLKSNLLPEYHSKKLK